MNVAVAVFEAVLFATWRACLLGNEGEKVQFMDHLLRTQPNRKFFPLDGVPCGNKFILLFRKLGGIQRDQDLACFHL